MKRCSLFCAGLWPFIFLPLLLLLPLLFFKWHAIEEHVAQNTEAKLVTAGADWAKVETVNRGRNVLITGTPPSEAAIDLAKDIAASAEGVHSVTISADVRPPAKPPELNISIEGKTIDVKGTLASQASISSVISQAESVFSKANVNNKLSVGNDTATLPALPGFFNSLSGKSVDLEPFNASLSGNTLTLTGTIDSNDSHSALLAQMKDVLGLEVDSQLVIAPPKISLATCQRMVNNRLENGSINFSSGQSKIQSSSFALLEALKSIIEGCPETNIEISGHTDSSGNQDFNLALSEQRAQSVVEYLLGLGLQASRMTAIGYGQQNPIAENATALGRSKNRRIEFKLKN